MTRKSEAEALLRRVTELETRVAAAEARIAMLEARPPIFVTPPQPPVYQPPAFPPPVICGPYFSPPGSLSENVCGSELGTVS